MGDRIRVGDGWAPFDLVRRYLVTGVVDGGRGRQYQHDAIVMAISQVARWGTGEIDVFADQDDWRAARLAVTRLMERYPPPATEVSRPGSTGSPGCIGIGGLEPARVWTGAPRGAGTARGRAGTARRPGRATPDDRAFDRTGVLGDPR